MTHFHQCTRKLKIVTKLIRHASKLKDQYVIYFQQYGMSVKQLAKHFIATINSLLNKRTYFHFDNSINSILFNLNINRILIFYFVTVFMNI